MGTNELQTASLYVNNQLLSRGLLRDGQPIDFTFSTEDGEDKLTSCGRIISIINDLILRRDRESLSATIHCLASENATLTKEKLRLKEQNAEEKRNANLSSASEAALKLQIRKTDAATRALKEDLARMKVLVTQNRAACAIEVRRRDRQNDALKKQLSEAGRSRGTRTSPAVMTINVTGETGLEEAAPIKAGSTAAEGYDLRSETNSFLATLAQELGEENEMTLRIMQRTIMELRRMSGYQVDIKPDPQVNKPSTGDELAADLASVMSHMRKILTNPSFTPIEEVVVREEEIERLKAGWLKMETRWREAVRLIDSWRKRMATSGKPVCEEELRMGLRLSPVQVKGVEETTDAWEASLDTVAEEDSEESHVRKHVARLSSPIPINIHDPIFSEDVPVGQELKTESANNIEERPLTVEDDAAKPTAEANQSRRNASLDSSPLPEPPQLSPLRKSSSAGNRRIKSDGRARKTDDKGELSRVESRSSHAPKPTRSLPLRNKPTARRNADRDEALRRSEQARHPSSSSNPDQPLVPDDFPAKGEAFPHKSKAQLDKAANVSSQASPARRRRFLRYHQRTAFTPSRLAPRQPCQRASKSARQPCSFEARSAQHAAVIRKDGCRAPSHGQRRS